MSKLFPFVYSAFVAASIAAANDVEMNPSKWFASKEPTPATASADSEGIAPIASWYGNNVYGIEEGKKLYFALKPNPGKDEMSANYVLTKHKEQATRLLETFSEMETWKNTKLGEWRKNNPKKDYPGSIKLWLESNQNLDDTAKQGLMGLDAMLLATGHNGDSDAHISKSEIEHAIEPWKEFKRK